MGLIACQTSSIMHTNHRSLLLWCGSCDKQILYWFTACCHRVCFPYYNLSRLVLVAIAILDGMFFCVFFAERKRTNLRYIHVLEYMVHLRYAQTTNTWVHLRGISLQLWWVWWTDTLLSSYHTYCIYGVRFLLWPEYASLGLCPEP
jgi:hypothetical protein